MKAEIKQEHQAAGSYTYGCNKADCYFCSKTQQYPPPLAEVFSITLPSLDRWQRKRIEDKKIMSSF